MISIDAKKMENHHKKKNQVLFKSKLENKGKFLLPQLHEIKMSNISVSVKT